MITVICFSVIAFVAGWLVSGKCSISFMEKKFVAWLRMSDYKDEEIERIVSEIKGIRI